MELVGCDVAIVVDASVVELVGVVTAALLDVVALFAVKRFGSIFYIRITRVSIFFYSLVELVLAVNK